MYTRIAKWKLVLDAAEINMDRQSFKPLFVGEIELRIKNQPTNIRSEPAPWSRPLNEQLTLCACFDSGTCSKTTLGKKTRTLPTETENKTKG